MLLLLEEEEEDVNKPHADILPSTLNIGTTNVIPLSITLSITGTHLPTNSNIVNRQNITIDGHDATTVSTHPSNASSDGLAFSIIPTMNSVRNGPTQYSRRGLGREPMRCIEVHYPSLSYIDSKNFCHYCSLLQPL